MQTSEERELCFPQLLNASCRRSPRPPSVSLLIYITLSLISLLTVTLNLLVIVSISHFKRLHSATDLLLLSLAVSDCLVGFLVCFQILLIDGCWYLGDVACALYFLLDYAITSASVGTMVLVSVDRYVAVCFPLHYSSTVTPERTRVCVVLCWLCSLAFHSVLLRDNLRAPGRFSSCSGGCVVVVDHAGGVVDLLLSFVGPVAVILVLYGKVFAAVMSQTRAVHHGEAGQRSPEESARKSEVKAAVALGVVVLVFLLCTCPYYCVVLVAEGSGVNASSAAFLLFYLNSTLNPLIYALFYRWFRKSVRLILTLQVFKPGFCDSD